MIVIGTLVMIIFGFLAIVFYTLGSSIIAFANIFYHGINVLKLFGLIVHETIFAIYYVFSGRLLEGLRKKRNKNKINKEALKNKQLLEVQKFDDAISNRLKFLMKNYPKSSRVLFRKYRNSFLSSTPYQIQEMETKIKNSHLKNL